MKSKTNMEYQTGYLSCRGHMQTYMRHYAKNNQAIVWLNSTWRGQISAHNAFSNLYTGIHVECKTIQI